MNDILIKRIIDAKRALRLSISFIRTDTEIVIHWPNRQLVFPCAMIEPDKTGFAVGIIHSLVCRNATAILDGSDVFNFRVGDEDVALYAWKPTKRDDSKWVYGTGKWRAAEEHENNTEKGE